LAVNFPEQIVYHIVSYRVEQYVTEARLAAVVARCITFASSQRDDRRQLPRIAIDWDRRHYHSHRDSSACPTSAARPISR